MENTGFLGYIDTLYLLMYHHVFYQYLLIPWFHQNIPIIFRSYHMHSYWLQVFQNCDFLLKNLALLIGNKHSKLYLQWQAPICSFLRKHLTNVFWIFSFEYLLNWIFSLSFFFQLKVGVSWQMKLCPSYDGCMRDFSSEPPVCFVCSINAFIGS